MSRLTRFILVVVGGVAIVLVALYSALPSHTTPVQAIKTGGTETALKIVGDAGGSVTRTFRLPPAPRNTPNLGIALRPATYLKRPSATITVDVGGNRCTFGPHQYTDGGTITCEVRRPGADTMRISVRRAAGPVALIERRTPSGRTLAGLWAQVPSSSLEGRLRFVMTALSTTRPWPFSWPLALFCFTFAVCASLGLGLVTLTRGEDLGGEATPDSRASTDAPA
jgi:hypothetical protein